MTTISPQLTKLLASQNTSNRFSSGLLVLFEIAVLVGVVLFVLDNIARTQTNDAAIAALTGHPQSSLMVGLPAMSWACSLLCGLPALVGIGYAMFVLQQSRGGGLDQAFLQAHWHEIVAVHAPSTSYQTKRGRELARTQTVIVTLKSGEATELTVRTRDAESIVALMRIELGLLTP